MGGRFVVLEGLDASGKSTQLRLLANTLERRGHKVKQLHFPRLEEPIIGNLIARFLRGELGAVETVDPYLVALLFAADRDKAKADIAKWLDEGYYVLCDRYLLSNIAFQTAKLSSLGGRIKLRDWIFDLEYGLNSLPKPHLTLYLNVPLSVVSRRLSRSRTGEDRAYLLESSRDIHESDFALQTNVHEAYLSLQGIAENYVVINCGSTRFEPDAIETHDKVLRQLVERGIV